MPTKHLRFSIVLEPLLLKAVAKLARQDSVSLSLKVRDLVRDALELYEDSYLSKVAQAREKSSSRSKALSHDQIWAA